MKEIFWRLPNWVIVIFIVAFIAVILGIGIPWIEKTIYVANHYYPGQPIEIDASQIAGLEGRAIIQPDGPGLTGVLYIFLPDGAYSPHYDFGGVPQARNRCDVTIAYLLPGLNEPEEKRWVDCIRIGERQIGFSPIIIRFVTPDGEVLSGE